jgi:thiol:disulfide interchange protein DsbC
VPVYLGDTFVIAGGMFQDRKDITGEGLKRITSQKFLALRHDIDQAVAFRYIPSGPVKHVLYLFASPTCAHCEELLGRIKPLLDETRTDLRVLFIANGMAEKLAIEAICCKVDLETYLAKQWMRPIGAELLTCADGVAMLRRSNNLSHRIGITWVPTVFTDKGVMLEGPQLTTLKAMLQEAETSR